ncbi:MAG: hypothetical protein EP329_14015 [Deltaproteobacteria bacterium]|nr:MAG: hypothetical protein EP329_14015 [Deltaproteobacteria bacterium]
MTAMTLEERVDAYLDGLMTRAEARQLEAELTEPAVGRVLAEAIALRELLAEAGPDLPPEGLMERIEASLGVDPHTELLTAPRKPERRRRFETLRSVLGGFAWTVRGPALAAAPAQSASGGLKTLGYTVAPIEALRRHDPAPPRPMWKRVLRIGKK